MRIKSTIIYNVVWKFCERAVSQIVSLIVSLVLARLLLPEDYGAISMVLIFIAFADVMITSGLPAALIQKKDADDIDFSSVFYINIFVAALLYMILFLLSPYIAFFFEMPILKSVLRVLGVRVILSGISSVQSAYVSRNMLFKSYFWATFLATLMSGIFGVTFAYVGLGVWALVSQQIVSALVGVVATYIVIRWRPKRLFSWGRVKELLNYGWKILFEGISETLTIQARNLIIGKVYTSEDLGYYTKAQQFPNILITNVVTSISSVLFPVMSNVQDEAKKVKELMRKSIKVTTYIMFPMVLGLALVAEPFIVAVLTEKWIECVPYLQIFCLTQGATVGMICRHEALKSIGRSDVYMYEHMVYRISVFIILFLVYKISVMAIAWSLIAGTIIMSVTVGITSKKYNGYGFKEQLLDVLPTTLACIAMAVPVYVIGCFALPVFIKLILQVGVGGVVYVLISHLFKIEGYVYIISLLKGILHREKEPDNV